MTSSDDDVEYLPSTLTPDARVLYMVQSVANLEGFAMRPRVKAILKEMWLDECAARGAFEPFLASARCISSGDVAGCRARLLQSAAMSRYAGDTAGDMLARQFLQSTFSRLDRPAFHSYGLDVHSRVLLCGSMTGRALAGARRAGGALAAGAAAAA